MSKASDVQKTPPVPSGRILRQRIDNGDVLLGLLLILPAPGILELVRGYDWFWIDGQHGQMSYDTILTCVRVADLVGVPPIVRVSAGDYSQIGPVLDTGPAGVMIPTIHNVQQAQAVADAAKFPPLGQRSFGGQRLLDRFGAEYADTANQDVFLIAQIESTQGLANVEQIAAVPGIDGLMFGPADYSLDSGIPIAAALGMTEPALWDAAERIAQSCAKHNKVACTLVTCPQSTVRLAQMGYQMLAVAIDAHLLSAAASGALDGFRQALRKT